MQIKVYYEDTDIAGIVYHTNYIKYCERARSEVFFSQGISPLEGKTRGFIVRDLQADFLATATLGDSLEVRSKLLSIKATSLILSQEIWKEEQKIFAMTIRLVYVEEGKPLRIPKIFKEMFENFV
jgi:acyl-CoA thioester hydrolase